MSGQSGGPRLRLSTLNDQLTCKLCGGYFIDATTIIECLHSFCKSCIVKYLENNKFCPICDAQVHKNKPLLNIRPDQTLQDIVYKLVPGCYQNEMRCRKEFFAKHPEEKNKVTSPEARGELVESYIYSPDESLSLSLEYYNPEMTKEAENDKEAALKHLPRRYLRCPAAVTVFHLQKLIRAKYGLSEAHRVDIMYEEEPLGATYMLMDVMYIYHWRRKVPLHLNYRIFESASKRLKLSEDNNDFKQSLSNSNMEVESKEEDQSIKPEWKEVQLKISETGVMSVTDISSLDTKKSTKVSEINQQSSQTQVTSNASNVNKTVVKIEEKELSKTCTTLSKNKKIQQESSSIKNVLTAEEKSRSGSLSAIPASQSNMKTEEMEIKTIDQSDLSNELIKNSSTEKYESKCSKPSDLTPITSSNVDKIQIEQELPVKIETVFSSDKRPEIRTNITNNNSINTETKTETSAKPNAKQSETKVAISAGSKINALSAKLQFQPKIGQINNTYSKKTTDRKATASSPTKIVELKSPKNSPKPEVKPTSTDPVESVETKPDVTTAPSVASLSSGVVASANPPITVPNLTTPPSTESLASIGLHVSTTVSNPNNWLPPTSKSSKELTADQKLRSIPGMPQIGKDIVCSTTSGSPSSSMGRFSIQTPSMSIYSITTSIKNNAYTSPSHSYTSPTKQSSNKSNFDVTSMYPVPPCPDAIPISLMKPVNTRKEPVAKGSTLNEICAKISNAGSGSKINDICAKIGESTKEKNKITEAQRNKPEVPDLLKISKKPDSGKRVPNIPNVPSYTPSSSSQTLQATNEVKDNSKRLASSITTSQASLIPNQMPKMATQKKHSQPVGYKTLRDPPKSWNPTLSKNNYVAAKNQAKELQNQAYGLNDGSSASKQIPSKPAKIFKIRNTPRYLGNPASGVKPMYGVVNDQPDDNDQSTVSKSSPTMNMMKIDPQTLCPIVSSPNSPIVSPPPPYSPTARSYQKSPFSRDIRNSSSPISPRNSPVNMLSTNPFIPSHTPNTNPRLIYSHFPPAFTDASRFSNPLIRSPIIPPDIPPPSAFHNSLPPSINKLYQRSGYLAQPQTSVAPGFSGSGPPSVQRIPPSSYSSSSSPSSKNSLSSLVTSSSSVSMVDTVALQLAKAHRDLNAFDLTRLEKPSGEKVSPARSRPTEAKSRLEKLDSKSNDVKQPESTSVTKESEKETNLAKVNGGIATCTKPKDELQSKSDNTVENKSATERAESTESPSKSSPSEESAKSDVKDVTRKPEVDAVESGKTVQGKKALEAQKGKAES